MKLFTIITCITISLSSLSYLQAGDFAEPNLYTQNFSNPQAQSMPIEINSDNFIKKPSTYLYAKNTDLHYAPIAAKRLIEESFISPEMQWTIISFLGKQHMTVNKVTGAVSDIPTLEELFDLINKKIQKPITKKEKETIKNVLHVMIEAINLAKTVAQIETEYQDQNFLLYQTINQELADLFKTHKDKAWDLINFLDDLSTISNPEDKPSSYFSWIPYFGSASKNNSSTISHESISVNPHSDLIEIPATLMPTIIKTNSYKEFPANQYAQAANLLFKQCFLAQQHHLKDMNRIEKLSIRMHGSVNAHNYLYNNFLQDPIKTPIQLIEEVANNIIAKAPTRSSVYENRTQAHLNAHELLLHARQAVQTAIYIANSDSTYNLGLILPKSIVGYLNNIVGTLLQYDNQLSELCKQPLYGATPEDGYYEERRANITKLAAGLTITAALAGTLALAAPATAASAATAIVSGVGGAVSNIGSAASYAKGLVSGAAAAITPSQKTWDTIADGATLAQKIGGKIGMTASVANIAGSVLMQGEAQGVYKLGPATKNAIQQIGKYTVPAMMYGNALGAAGGLYLAGKDWNDISKDWKDNGAWLWSSNEKQQTIFGPIFATFGLIASTTSATSAVPQAFTQTNQLIASTLQTTNPAEKASAQEQLTNIMYQACNQGIQKSLTEEIDPVQGLAGSVNLLLSKQIPANLIALTVAKLHDQYAVQNNPEVVAGCRLILQKLAELEADGQTNQTAQ
ncbi:MAG: hypothetical protein ACXWL2_03315 [Candidatus Chromulinivorax sp.]